MTTFNSLEYKLEKYKYQTIFGLRKITWIIIGMVIILLMPAYLIGFYSADMTQIGKYDTSKEIVNALTESRSVEYKITKKDTLQAITGERDLYVKIDTKEDKHLGYYPWIYTYTIYDRSDKIVKQDTVSSYLLPDEELYLVIPVEETKGIRLEIETNQDQSRIIYYDDSLPQFFKDPDIEVKSYSFQPNENNDELFDVEFSLENKNNFVDIGKVDVYYILRSIDKNILGIGKYSFNDFFHNTIKEVSLKYPKPLHGTINSIEIVPVVNFLDIENIQTRK